MAGHSRRHIESECNNILTKIDNWGKDNKLDFNPAKTKAMVMARNFTSAFERRLPIIKMRNENIQIVKKLNYLGVTIDNRMSWNEHIKGLKIKCNIIFNKLEQVANGTWGLRSSAMEGIYDGMFVPIMTYAASVWCGKVHNSLQNKHLRQAQRIALLRLTKCYRTTSTEGLMVLAGRLQLPHPAMEFRVQEMDQQRCYTEIYTDGSKTNEGTGAAIVVYERNEEIYSQKYKLEEYCSNFQAELLAIYKAVEWCIQNNKSESVCISTDSLSALQALLSHDSKQRQVYEIKKLLYDKRMLKSIKFKWVRAHVGIYGNERADRLAKKAISDTQVIFDIRPKFWAKTLLRNETIRIWQQNWTNSDKGRKIFGFLPNIEERIRQMKWLNHDRIVMIFLSGHDGLGEFKRRFSLGDRNGCICGEDIEDLKHIISYRGKPFDVKKFSVDPQILKLRNNVVLTSSGRFSGLPMTVKPDSSTFLDVTLCGLFIDIAGAFDNIWWPAVLRVLRRRNCPMDIYRVINSYFDHRIVRYSHGEEYYEKLKEFEGNLSEFECETSDEDDDEIFIPTESTSDSSDPDSDESEKSPPILGKRRAITPHPSQAKRKKGALHMPEIASDDKNHRCRMPRCNSVRARVFCTVCKVHLCLVTRRNCFKAYHAM
ncbi:uncharacterized protein LOC111615713 [Centruroides sculpturatus]|uniref:uncharacterized protein LOC111615713 n=1 Tax=Centruroides sculpturatus TaxID=218467 RepID=UPI000C6CCDF8|nr:uncharacterized protein LOC111615713 [Centruroides sculpturatus]